MPSNPILICARSDDLRMELEGALRAAGHETIAVTTPADAVAAMRGREVDLIVAEGLTASGAIGSLRMAGDEGPTPILVVAPARDVEARIAFLEAGADDVIPTGFARNELDARVMALLIRTGRIHPGPGQTQAGELVGVFAPKGGVGTTMLAVNASVLLATGAGPPRRRRRREENNGVLPGSRVLLIDLHLQFGQVATHLNLTSRYDIAGLASDEQALADPELATSYLTWHDSGLAVLTAPADPEADLRVTLDQLQRVVEVLRPSFDRIVFDLGSRLDERTIWVLEQADINFLVVVPEIAALRATSMLASFLAESTPLRARTHFVVNHLFAKEVLRTKDIEDLLRASATAEIPFTESEMIRSLDEGVPFVTQRPESPAALAIRRIAQTIVGTDTEPQRAEPRRRRIFGRR
jgi:pilus assembly protein CpaE